MTGKDLVNYILEHKLEDAELDYGISDPLQFVVKISNGYVGVGKEGERELVYDFTRDFVYERYPAAEEISYEEAAKRRLIKEEARISDEEKQEIFNMLLREAMAMRKKHDKGGEVNGTTNI